MRVIISAGGTGGHIYPALAILNKIKEMEPDSEFLYIGTHNRMEKDIVPAKNIPYKALEIYGLNLKKPFKNIKTLMLLKKAYQESIKTMQEFKPDIVIGVGGYVTVPVIKAAHKLGIKTFIHEQNSISGKSNKYLAKYVDMVGVSFKSTIHDYENGKAIFTGNPVSESALLAIPADKTKYGLSRDKKLVLFVMGSLGSKVMNDFIDSLLPKFKDAKYEVMFVTGKQGYDDYAKKAYPDNVFVVPYVEEMSRLLHKTDLIVSRAGASTMAEIIALKIPSIIVPSPYVANNHQYKNALDLYESNACIMIEEKNLNTDEMKQRIDEILNDDAKKTIIKDNLTKFNIEGSATIIYENLRKLIDRK